MRVCWRLLEEAGSLSRSVWAEGRGAAARDSHLKLGGDAMCSPRNGEEAGGDAAPPPRPPLSRSAILPHSPGHPGGARRGGGGKGGGGGGGEGGGDAAGDRRCRRGAPAGRARRAHLRRVVRGSGPHATLGTGASAPPGPG